jgi:hypothetical protein
MREDDPNKQADFASEETKALARELLKETKVIPCDCVEDGAKLWGGHKKDCPNAIPF